MPNGETREKLLAEIESDVRYMLAHDIRPTVEERRNFRSAWVWFILAAFLGGIVAFDPFVSGTRWLTAVFAFIGVLAVALGAGLLNQIRRSRLSKRWANLEVEERDQIERRRSQPTDLHETS